MKTIRLVLKEPFYMHPASLVFELEDSNEYSGWDDDERVRDRMSFHDKRIYHLPDSGRGLAVSLPASITQPCPAAAFENIDLSTGPCRITKVISGKGEALLAPSSPLPCGTLREEKVSLQEVNGLSAQGLRIELPAFEQAPVKMVLKDCLRKEVVASKERNFISSMLEPFTPSNQLLSLAVNPADNSLHADCSTLLPGFYQLLLCFPGDCVHSIQFIKSFPLRVEFNRIGGTYSLHKTLY